MYVLQFEEKRCRVFRKLCFLGKPVCLQKLQTEALFGDLDYSLLFAYAVYKLHIPVCTERRVLILQSCRNLKPFLTQQAEPRDNLNICQVHVVVLNRSVSKRKHVSRVTLGYYLYFFLLGYIWHCDARPFRITLHKYRRTVGLHLTFNGLEMGKSCDAANRIFTCFTTGIHQAFLDS